MKVWVDKENLKWFREMQDEGRTREIKVSSFKMFTNNSEIEVELK